MGLAVVTVAAGGLPIVESTVGGTPVTEATNGRGVPVTKVVGKPGLPVVFTVAGPLAIGAAPATTGIEYEHGIGSSYAGFMANASGGTPPYTYSLVSGTLPAGITLNSSTGAVTGTPAFQSAGTYSNIGIRVTDNVAATANLAPFTITVAFKDPYWSNVQSLFDYDAANGSTSFIDAVSNAAIQVNGNTQHSTVVTPLYGTSSFLFDGTGDYLAWGDIPLWTLGAAPFTIDFTARPTNITGSHFWIAHWATAAPNLGWALSSLADRVQLAVSTNGTNSFEAVGSVAGTVVINVWARWRIDFDGTKYRVYKDGVMIGSAVTLYTIADVAANLSIGGGSAGAFGFAGNCRGVRLTVGIARTASDSGYTISNRAFPTS